MTTPRIEEQMDYSRENMEALELFTKCIKNGYSIRIDGLTLTEYPKEKVISLKPNNTLTQARQAGIDDVVQLYGPPKCDNLHHKKAHQHEMDEPCPVEQAIKALQDKK